jgi:HEPN domain-containing protein
MNKQEKYEYWLEHAQYDMKASEAMLNAGIWVYAVFMCQQGMEKLVKGLYCLLVDENEIPRVHNLKRLVKAFEHKMPEPISPETYELLVTLSGYYLNNRYPDFKTRLTHSTTESKARELYMRSKEVFAWLQTMRP